MIRELMTLQDRMNRLFEEILPIRRTETEEEFLFSGTWTPLVDIYEKDDAVVLKADLPDVDPKDIDIRIEGNRLFLKGERKYEKEVKKENFYRSERVYGTFARSFILPTNVAVDKIEAVYKNGVLHLTMPKRQEAKPIKIDVKK